MKKIILIIVFISGCIIAQSWNNIVTTTINEPNLVQLDNFVNRDGIHIVVQNSNSTNSIKYYRLNSLGVVQTTTTIESSGGAEFPHIAGDNDHMFISYRLGNNIVSRKYNYTTSSWDPLTSISLNNHDCNSVDNAYDFRGLHIVFSEFDGSNSYKTHYYLYATTIPSNHFVVNDYADYLGWPTISLSSNKAHVGFHSDGYAKTRDKNLTNNSWESSQAVASADGNERVQSGCDKLFDFYDVLVPGVIVNLYVKERDINGSTWSTPQLLNYSVHPYLEGRITSTITSDGKTHILYDSQQLLHRSYNCSTSSWSDEYEVTSYSGLTQSSGISAVSNDLYVVYREYPGGSTYIKYRQYDAVPLAPQNLAVEIYTEGNETYPKLTWTLNNEPDVYIKINAYQIQRRYSLNGGPWSAWYIIGYTNGNVSEYVDYTISGLYAEAHTAEYRIRVRDYTNHFSDFSSTVSINFRMFNKSSNGYLSFDYELNQNYPNPFNPTTTINYSIKTGGEVTLKVYDMLGTEVASLVNERQEAGNYTVEFNATDFPSGIYFYTLISGNFMDTKKLILLK
jgi:hypothetical protein